MDKKKLRIVFMGTPDFAVSTLEILLSNKFNVVGVITAPDKPAGRGLKIQTSPVKDVAVLHGIPLLQPTNLKDPAFHEELKKLNANLQIVVAFRMLPEVVWNMPEIGTINLHGSLLPNYRGAAPINWAIINGETETGCTTFFLQHEIDTGDILFTTKEEITPNDTFETLYNRLKIKGAELVLKTVQAIEEGNYNPSPQVYSSNFKNAPKIHKETCKINWTSSAHEIRNFIRGLSPYPAAWTEVNGKTIKIYSAEVVHKKSAVSIGNYETDNKTYLHFQSGDGMVALTELQMEGKKRMGIEEFLRGAKL